jgi:hypothetical protein
VPEDSPEAAALLVGEGGTLTEEEAAPYAGQLPPPADPNAPAPPPAETEEAGPETEETKARQGAATKAVTPEQTSNKARGG